MPVFSSMTINFLTDFDEDYTCTLGYNTLGSSFNDQYTWVTTRSAGYEVTTGTPTGTPGETTAINFEAAFDLDNPVDYITTQTTNSLLIESEVADLIFIGFKARDELGVLLVEGVDFALTFDNYEIPFDVTNLDSVLTKSPHYVYTPFFFETTTSMNLSITVYTGDFATPPATPTYTLTKVRPTIDYTQFNTNISDVIQPQLTNEITISVPATSQLVNAGLTEYVWINYEATYVDPVETTAPVLGYFGASYGFGRYSEGVNPTLPNGVLTPATSRRITRDGIVMLPFKNNDYYNSVKITAGADHSNTIALASSALSTEFVQYIQIDVSALPTATSIILEFTKTAGGIDTITYNIIDECLNDHKTVLFTNRYGFYDTLYMFGKSSDSLDVKKDTFINNYVSNGVYDVSTHQIKDINILGNESIKCFSGYIREGENELYRDLMLSGSVFFYAGNETVTPMNIATKSLEFKTRINDQQVIYEIEFDYAYNTIQNV